MGACGVVGVDVDQDALEIARRNLSAFDISNVDLIYSDVQTLNILPGNGRAAYHCSRRHGLMFGIWFLNSAGHSRNESTLWNKKLRY